MFCPLQHLTATGPLLRKSLAKQVRRHGGQNTIFRLALHSNLSICWHQNVNEIVFSRTTPVTNVFWLVAISSVWKRVANGNRSCDKMVAVPTHLRLDDWVHQTANSLYGMEKCYIMKVDLQLFKLAIIRLLNSSVILIGVKSAIGTISPGGFRRAELPPIVDPLSTWLWKVK